MEFLWDVTWIFVEQTRLTVLFPPAFLMSSVIIILSWFNYGDNDPSKWCHVSHSMCSPYRQTHTQHCI